MVMPGMDGLQTLANCKKLRPDQKVVMISCVNDTNKVVQAIQLGASDYVTKPFLSPQFQGAIRKALGTAEQNQVMQNHVPAAGAPLAGNEMVDDLGEGFFFLAASPAMKQIRAQAALIAKVNVPVLLLGESGVGKEILARLIHKMSIRADLLESELFGYEAGAFTGAGKSKPGKFELAHKGTILLDEIGEMSAGLQAKLLHVLQDGTFSRLGGRANVQVDARVLAATNIDVKKAIAERRLREDLYYRLNAFTLTVPPLRERREEIPVLLRYYMNNLARQYGKNTLPISGKLEQECLRYHWPGNLRELGNLVKRYLVLNDENQLVDELRSKARDAGAEDGAASSSGRGGLKALVRNLKDDAEAREIQRALDDANWNRKVAAAELNISYKALLYKIKQHGLSPSGSREVGLRAKVN
jgi:DNA-binding NtrC family response regulator